MCCFVFACMVTSLSVCRPLTKNQDKIRRWDTLCFVTSIHHYFQMEDRPNKTFQYCHTIIGVVCSIFPQTTTTIRKRWLLYLLSFSFLFVLQHFDSICPDKVSRNLFLPMINGVDNFFFVFFLLSFCTMVQNTMVYFITSSGKSERASKGQSAVKRANGAW